MNGQHWHELARTVEAARAELDNGYREVWVARPLPGGWVCSACGTPTESEPCPDHAPAPPPINEIRAQGWPAPAVTRVAFLLAALVCVIAAAVLG